jgi:hypothetical protein
MRSKSDIPASTGNPAPAADFGTELKTQTDPPAAGTASSPHSVGTMTQTDPAAAGTASSPHSIGTMTPWSPAAVVTNPAPATTSSMAPTAQSLFGDNPWSTGAGGSGPSGSYAYNPLYFATPATAAKVAEMLGGKVVEVDDITPFGPFKQNQPNQMVQMPDGRLINAGLVAGFYDRGYTQQMVDKMVAAEVSGDLLYS